MTAQTAEQSERDDARLPYPPPWQDIATLCKHICASESTVDRWVKLGKLPAPTLVEGKRLWEWKEVNRHLKGKGKVVLPSADAEAERVRDESKRDADARH